MANETERAADDSRSDPNTAELERLFSENLRWLRGWLGARLSGRDRQEVDDLCQDVLLRALRGYRRLRDRSKFPAWLYRIAMNVLRDHVRSARHRRQEIQATDVEILDPRQTHAAVDRAEEVRLALREVLELPPKLREPMLLRHIDDLSYAEISTILGVSENAIQVRMFRARERLRRTTAYRRLFGDDSRHEESPTETSREDADASEPTTSSRRSGRPERFDP